MEVRQLEAFAAVATELHFGRAAEKLHMGQPTLSELIRRLERELGTALFTRTTRRVALTGAGSELLIRSKVILDEISAATVAVRRIADGDAGTVRVGITPPVAPVLAPHLSRLFALAAPNVTLTIEQLWLPTLTAAVAAGEVDVALTCGITPEREGIACDTFCAEPLLVGLRPDHRLADAESIDLRDLAYDVVGLCSDSLFPAWALSQKQCLQQVGISPPSVQFEDTDLAATRWADQLAIDWIMLIGSLTRAHETTVLKPTRPEVLVPFVVQWAPDRARTAAVARFVHLALTADPPAGWRTKPGHRTDAAPAAWRHGPLESG